MKKAFPFFMILSWITGAVANAQTAKLEFVDHATKQVVSEVLVGTAVEIQISGLTPLKQMRLTCDNTLFKSEAYFRTGLKGEVNLAKDPSIHGTYEGTDMDGMFWSRVRQPVREDTPATPFTCHAYLNEVEVAQGSLNRIWSAPGIVSRRLTEKEVGFEASFATPTGEGPFPLLVVLGGSEGGLSEENTTYFASLGYATLTVAYYAFENLPKQIDRIPLEYFKKALEWAKQQPQVKKDRAGVIGVSRGGELALLLGATFPDFTAVVANVPSGVAWSGGYDSVAQKSTSSWTYQGQDIPFVLFHTEVPPAKEKLADGKEIIKYSNVFRAGIQDPQAVRAATFPVEKIRGPVLILGGADDQVWPSCDLGNIAFARLKRNRHASKDEFECYPNAGHVIGIPGWSLMENYFYHPVFQEYQGFGGTPKGNAQAQRLGWEKVLSFLDSNLRK